jgi:diguanylate cyclase (GGDEF)-like protein/PAS domain S-box-containing protein
MVNSKTAEISQEKDARLRNRTSTAFAWLKPPGWFPYLVLGLGIALSLEAWRFASSMIEAQIALELKDRSAQAKTAFDRHILDYVYAAHKLQGALEATASVTRKDFARYVQGIGDGFPGFLSLQFVRPVSSAARAQFLVEVRGDSTLQPEGYPNFAIKPDGDRPEYMVIDFVEPLQANEVAFGLDVLSIPDHRAAAERARDSGQPSATGPHPSGGAEPHNRSFTLYLPVYRLGALHHTAAHRRQAFLGLVGAEFGTAEFMQSLLSRDTFRHIRVVVRDLGPFGHAVGTAQDQTQNLVFDSLYSGASGVQTADLHDARQNGHPYNETMNVGMGGRNWGVTFQLAASPGAGTRTALPLVLLAGGMLASLLLFGLAWSLSTSRDRALSLATRMTEGLRDSEARARTVGEMLPIPMLTARLEDGAIITMNRRAAELFGVSAESAIGTPVGEYSEDPAQCKRLITRIYRDDHVRDFELRLKSASASPIWVMLSAQIIEHQGERVLLMAMVDISDRKRAEKALRTSEEEFRLIAESSGDMIAVLDTDGRRLYNNPSYTRILGEAAQLAGTDSFQEIHPEDRERIRKLLFDTVSTGQGHRAKYRFLRKSGSVYHIESQGNAIRDETGKVSRIVVVSRDITEQALTEEKIRQLAHHDSLTGLPNRVLLKDRLEQAIAQAERNRTQMGVMILDLDEFKKINDTLGHEAGDEALQTVAERLRTSVRRVDTVARLGGDEFVVVLPSIRSGVDVEQVARKIIESMSKPLAIKDQSLKVSMSIGASIFPADGFDATVLMKRADLAMYRAKQKGRNRYQPFSEKSDADVESLVADR